jgi:F-type H+-transporting ATPase subunit b
MKNKKILAIIFATFLGLFSLTSCDASGLSTDMSNNIIDALIPNFWAFLTQFLAFIVLIVLVTIFAYKPLRKFMDDRSEYLDNEVKNANKNNAQSKVNLEESETNIAIANKKAVAIVEEAKTSAVLERTKILNEADQEVTMMKDKAQKEIAAERKEAEKQIKNEIINVALDASEHVLSREVNKKDNEKIIDDFVTSMNDAKNTESEIK